MYIVSCITMIYIRFLQGGGAKEKCAQSGTLSRTFMWFDGATLARGGGGMAPFASSLYPPLVQHVPIRYEGEGEGENVKNG